MLCAIRMLSRRFCLCVCCVYRIIIIVITLLLQLVDIVVGAFYLNFLHLFATFNSDYKVVLKFLFHLHLLHYAYLLAK